MPKFKNLDSFSPIQEKNKKKNKNLSKSLNHTTFVSKIKNQGSWVLKYLDQNYSEAIEETVAQEFFRLVCPFYPKTRWLKENDKYCVLSKEIFGFDPYFLLGPEGKEAITSKNLRGLASAQVLSLLLNEIDFRATNVGIDAEGRVIKIDGGLCFAKGKSGYEYLLGGKNFNITSEDIEVLPALRTYQPVNWLDFIEYREVEAQDSSGNKKNEKQSLRNPNSSLLHLSEASLAFFRAELNQTILRICLIPDTLIHYFTCSYVPENEKAKQLAEVIINRKKQLQTAVNSNQSFNDYTGSKKAQEDILAFTNELALFKTMGKSALVTHIKEKQNYDVKEEIYKKFIRGYEPAKLFLIKLNTYLSSKAKKESTRKLFKLFRQSRQEKISLANVLKGLIENYLEYPDSEQLKSLYDQLLIAKNQYLKKLHLFKQSTLTVALNKLIHAIKPFTKADLAMDNFEKSALIPSPIKMNKENSLKENAATLFKPKIRKTLIAVDQMLYGLDCGLENSETSNSKNICGV
jgi:hypothetical protein